jgi:hypothetical protein
VNIDLSRIETLSPLEIDKELEASYYKEFELKGKRVSYLNTMHNMVKDKKWPRGRGSQFDWATPHEEVVTQLKQLVADGKDDQPFYGSGAMAKYLGWLDETDAKLAEIKKQSDEVDKEFIRRGGWTRAFIVRGNDGHIHKDMHCRTCRITTQYGWLPEYSGKDEAEIVADAGDRACTVCYPSAPVDVLKRPSKIAKMPKLS